MTRNTRLFTMSPKIKGKAVQIIYRDLNVLELSFLRNIKNKVVQFEMAGKLAVTNYDLDKIPWPVLQQIGGDILTKSMECVTDMDLQDIAISEFRNTNLGTEPFMSDILVILKHFPGQSITELLKLTHKDLIELVVMCEKITNSKIYGGKPTASKNTHLVNPKDLPDGGKLLQREIEKLSSRGNR